MLTTIRRAVGFIVGKLAGVLHEELEKHHHKLQLRQQSDLIVQFQSCGRQPRLNGQIMVTHPDMTCLGDNVHIGDNAYFYTTGGLYIGDNTHISRNVSIYTANHIYEGTALPYDEQLKHKPVLIGKNVWIGMNVNIAPGTIVEDGAVIGIGNTLSGRVPAGSVIGHARPEIIKQRDKAHYDQLEQASSYGGINGKPVTFTDSRLSADETVFTFVVSTGRSGTTSIARYLNQSDQIDFFHERRKQLLRLSYEYACGNSSEERILEELDAIYVRTTQYTKAKYGESDHHIFNMISCIRKVLPQARFIWLVRSAKDVVQSGVHRGWYSDEETHAKYDVIKHDWNRYRIRGDHIGVIETEEWQRMSVFERNCWYWSYVNEQIEKQLQLIDSTNWIRMTLENLVQQREELASFTGISDLNHSFPHENQNKVQMNTKAALNEKQQQAYDRWCKPLMERFYGQ